MYACSYLSHEDAPTHVEDGTGIRTMLMMFRRDGNVLNQPVDPHVED
jgi:hypothetical protein